MERGSASALGQQRTQALHCVAGQRTPTKPFLTRQTAFVRANSSLQNAKDFSGDGCVALTGHGARHRRGLSLGSCGELFRHHAARFALSASPTRCKSHHAKCDDILRLETKLHTFENQCEPRIEQGTPDWFEVKGPIRCGPRAALAPAARGLSDRLGSFRLLVHDGFYNFRQRRIDLLFFV